MSNTNTAPVTTEHYCSCCNRSRDEGIKGCSCCAGSMILGHRLTLINGKCWCCATWCSLYGIKWEGCNNEQITA